MKIKGVTYLGQDMDVYDVHVRADYGEEEFPGIWYYVYGSYCYCGFIHDVAIKAFRNVEDALGYAQELKKQIQAEKEAVPFT